MRRARWKEEPSPPTQSRALNRDRDELIDLLDDHLTGENRLFRETRGIEIGEPGGQLRTVWRYRFNQSLDQRIARIRFSSPAEQRNLAQRLAPALVATYAPQEHRVATTLSALFLLAGNPEAARHYRRIANLGVSRTGFHGDLVWWFPLFIVCVSDGPRTVERRGRPVPSVP